jgi:lipopolysaccharide export system ATP-binding protein
LSTVLAGLGLGKCLSGRSIVEGVSVAVGAGEVVGVFGPNGAGKTTTLRMLAGVLSPDTGRVELAGADVTRLPLSARARRGLAYLPQEPTVFRALSAKDNVLAYLEAAHGASPRPKGRHPRAGRSARAAALLAGVGLSDRAASRADTLSGGERRRLELARALALDPRVLVCDEPFAGIDRPSATELAGLLLSLARQHGVGVLLCDHAIEVAVPICDRAVLLEGGRVKAEGTPGSLAALDLQPSPTAASPSLAMMPGTERLEG